MCREFRNKKSVLYCGWIHTILTTRLKNLEIIWETMVEGKDYTEYEDKRKNQEDLEKWVRLLYSGWRRQGNWLGGIN